jgi:hypothetical protein
MGAQHERLAGDRVRVSGTRPLPPGNFQSDVGLQSAPDRRWRERTVSVGRLPPLFDFPVKGLPF